MRHCFPPARSGGAIGLLGGSFDPPHDGHVQITLEALKRFDLDEVWWLVSPGNPLKRHGPAPLARRMEAARGLMQHPRVRISDIEARLGTRYTAQTLQAMLPIYPATRFVWLMGADNLAQFDRWQNWRWIIETLPLGILARPGERISARTSKAAAIYEHARLRGRESRLLARMQAPAWCYVNLPLNAQSSSRLRAGGAWEAARG